MTLIGVHGGIDYNSIQLMSRLCACLSAFCAMRPFGITGRSHLPKSEPEPRVASCLPAVAEGGGAWVSLAHARADTRLEPAAGGDLPGT